jgi:F0F1-type ATP synthase membrane subunit c/vacuolar-type H+-ATPase subunit K
MSTRLHLQLHQIGAAVAIALHVAGAAIASAVLVINLSQAVTREREAYDQLVQDAFRDCKEENPTS